MSVDTNIELYERAAECIDYFEGKLPASLIETDIANGDLDTLSKHVSEAEQEMAQQHFFNNELLGDEY